jgi:hypothetical protein
MTRLSGMLVIEFIFHFFTSDEEILCICYEYVVSTVGYKLIINTIEGEVHAGSYIGLCFHMRILAMFVESLPRS